MMTILKAEREDSGSAQFSIGAFLREVDEQKRHALALLKSAMLSGDDLEKVAKSVYMSTFTAALNLDYSDYDASGNCGCIEPMRAIVSEVESYGFPMHQGAYAARRLAWPAWRFAVDNLMESHPFYNKGMQKDILRSIWRRREKRPDIEEMVSLYESMFEAVPLKQEYTLVEPNGKGVRVGVLGKNGEWTLFERDESGEFSLVQNGSGVCNLRDWGNRPLVSISQVDGGIYGIRKPYGEGLKHEMIKDLKEALRS